MTGRSESAIHSFTLPDDQRGLRETTKPALGNPSDPAVPEPDRSSAGNADSLSILCLGPFRVYRDKHMIGDWHSLKGLLILKYMVRHHKTPVAKDVLMDVFWPEADQEVARRNLHQAIYNLRQMLRRGQPDFRPILFENDCYLFNPENALNLDFEAFERHVQTGRRLEAAGRSPEAFAEYKLAEELYRGDFLEQDPYEDWASLQREQIRNSYLEIADCLSEQQCRQGEYAAAIELCQKILAKDNCHEHAHRRLMRCYQCLGQRGSVIRQYRQYVEVMKRELDMPPSEETQSLLGKFVGAGTLNWLARLIN
jgi:DNA-binding SARP family transcriptional activator